MESNPRVFHGFCPYEFPMGSHGNSMVCWSLLFHEFSMADSWKCPMSFPWLFAHMNSLGFPMEFHDPLLTIIPWVFHGWLMEITHEFTMVDSYGQKAMENSWVVPHDFSMGHFCKGFLVFYGCASYGESNIVTYVLSCRHMNFWITLRTLCINI